MVFIYGTVSGRRCLWHERLLWWETRGGLAENVGFSPSLPLLQYHLWLLWKIYLIQRMQWVAHSLQIVGTLCEIVPVSISLPSILLKWFFLHLDHPISARTSGRSFSGFSCCLMKMNVGQLGHVLNSWQQSGGKSYIWNHTSDIYCKRLGLSEPDPQHGTTDPSWCL